MEALSLEMIMDEKKAVLEAALKKADNIETFEIDSLDKKDERKSVVMYFKEPVNINYVHKYLVSVLGEHKAKKIE